MNTKAKISLDEYVARHGARTKRSRLDSHADEIAAAVERGLTLTQIAEWLSLNGVKITQPGLAGWLRRRAEQAVRRLETLSSMPDLTSLPVRVSRTPVEVDRRERRRGRVDIPQVTAAGGDADVLLAPVGPRNSGAPNSSAFDVAGHETTAAQLRALAEAQTKQDDSFGSALFKSSGPISKK